MKSRAVQRDCYGWQMILNDMVIIALIFQLQDHMKYKIYVSS